MTDNADGRLLAHIVEQVRQHAVERPSAVIDRDFVAAVIAADVLMLSPARRLQLIDQVLDEVMGAGVLAPLLRQPGVTDVLVNAPDRVYIDDGAGLHRVAVTFPDESAVRQCAQRLARAANRRLDDAQPYVDARLPGGERLHALLPPIARDGTAISIRVPAARRLSWPDIADASSLSREARAIIEEAVSQRESLLITGGTGSGKTTVLNALLGECAAADRIVIVEDTAELAPAHPHVVRLEGRAPNVEGAGSISMATLVRQSLRMRPDRIIVGEVRGAEVEDLLRALNTGHTGSMATLHANSAADVPSRIEVLAPPGGLSARGLQAAMATAFGLIIHMTREPGGLRRIAAVARMHVAGGRAQVRECL